MALLGQGSRLVGGNYTLYCAPGFEARETADCFCFAAASRSRLQVSGPNGGRAKSEAEVEARFCVLRPEPLLDVSAELGLAGGV